MKKINQETLYDLIYKHNEWLCDKSKGKRFVVSNYDMTGLEFDGLDLSKSYFSFCDLRNASMLNTKLNGARLKDTSLRGADLQEADLQDADLHDIDLSGANLDGACLCNVNLGEADLQLATLRGANLTGDKLLHANLSGANLIEANLSKADLFGANLMDADLFKADLTGANLKNVKLDGAKLTGAKGIIYICTSYDYQSYGYTYDDKLWVQLGCYNRTLDEWDEDFWNNETEFPKDSPKGRNRYLIYQLIKNWLIATYR